MRLFFIVMILSSTMLSATAGVVKKASQLIYAGNYQEANLLLEKGFVKDTNDFALYYLKALSFYRKDNPNASLEKAFQFNSTAVRLLDHTIDEKLLAKYATLDIREYTINDLQQRIYRDAFEQVDSVNAIQNWEHYMAFYKGSPYLMQAVRSRNALAYNAAKGKFTYQSFKEFMEMYPNASQTAEAEQLYESLLYREKTKDGSATSYMDFIKAYPKSPYVAEATKLYETQIYKEYTADDQPISYINFVKDHPKNPYRVFAEDSIYSKLTVDNTIDDLDYFVRKFSGNRNVKLAWKRLYELYNVTRNAEQLLAFSKEYPGFPYREQLKKDLDLASLKLEVFEVNGFYGAMDEVTGDTIIQPAYRELYPFTEGLAAFSPGECSGTCLYGFLDKKGREVIAPIYSEVVSFEDGLAAVSSSECLNDDCRWGYIDRNGEIIADLVYLEVSEYRSALALVECQNEKYGFIDRNGQQAIPCSFVDAGNFQEGYAPISDSTGKWGFIDGKGQIVLPMQFTNAREFALGFAPVADTSGKWGFINTEGIWHIKPQFAYANSFMSDSTASVLIEGLKGVLAIKREAKIDLKGNILEP